MNTTEEQQKIAFALGIAVGAASKGLIKLLLRGNPLAWLDRTGRPAATADATTETATEHDATDTDAPTQ